MKNRPALYLFLCTLLISGNVWSANSFYLQARQVSLLTVGGEKIEVGELTFSDNALAVVSFDFKPNYETFTDFFLSMKEMKCLEGPELWCPISPADLSLPPIGEYEIEDVDPKTRWLANLIIE